MVRWNYTKTALILFAVGGVTYFIADALTYWWLPGLIHGAVCAALPLFGLTGTTCGTS